MNKDLKHIIMEKIEIEIKRQSSYVLKLYEKQITLKRELKALTYERAKLIGMLDIAQLLNIDIDEYNYIYNI